MPSSPFHFKEFSVYHHNSTMKIGTDAILLAAWSDVHNSKQILDIGTGSGVIALMVASKSFGNVDAIEPHHDSYIEAKQNFAASKFRDHLHIFESDLLTFSKKRNKCYDYIITNPPFFSNGLLPLNMKKEMARHTTSLNHKELIASVDSLLSSNGVLGIVLPIDESDKFLKIANNYNLFPKRKLVIKAKESKPANRVNIEFSREVVSLCKTEMITIRKENNQHTEEYKDIVGKYLIRI